ncbi:MAG: hypothetical protein ACI9UR_001661 [Bacteroidia bacterium]|jgi:hypothetical protein
MRKLSLTIISVLLTAYIAVNAQNKSDAPSIHETSELNGKKIENPNSAVNSSSSVEKSEGVLSKNIDKTNHSKRKALPIKRSADMLERKKIEPKLSDPQ